MDTQHVEVTQIVTLILKTGTSCPASADASSDTNLAQCVERSQARLTTLLDRFMLELGDPVRFRGERELPIYGIWRRRYEQVISQVATQLQEPRYPTAQEILEVTDREKEE